ncbi:MAG: M20/M25/M40 family metallo-hydrolase, partial [Clostridia bacterium]
NAPSASGFEHTAARRAALVLERYVDEVRTDALGNVIGIRRSGRANAKCVLLDAHIDEIGLIVTGYDGNFLRFSTLGGVDPRMLPAREVLVLTDTPIHGVITCLPPHVQEAADMNASFPIDKLHIDLGIKNPAARVPVGTPVVYAADTIKLENDFISGRAMDDRAGFAALLHTLERLKGRRLAVDVVVVGSVQEELGCRGATVAGFSVAPDLAIAVDVTHGTTPDAGAPKTFETGSGVAIGIGPSLNRKVSNTLTRIARDRKIKYTLEVMEGDTSTNAWPLAVTREGVPTGLLSLPLKYMHTPFETLRECDIKAVSRLLAEYLLTLGSEVPRHV